MFDNFEEVVSVSRKLAKNSNDTAIQKVFNATQKSFDFPILDGSGNVSSYITAEGWVAGGWGKSDLRTWANGELLTSLEEKNPGLSEALQMVIKVSDIGRPTDNTLAGQLTNQKITTNDWIWIPSVTELSTDADPGNPSIMDEQSSMVSGDGTYLPYPWFSTDDTRIKNFEGKPSKYWTRTHSINLSQRYRLITETGTNTDLSCRSSLGLVFGFCV